MEWDSIKQKLLEDSHPFSVTGGMVKSISICDRQAYFHQQDIDVVPENEHIQLGNLVEERFYDDESQESIIIDGMIAPDEINDGVIYETKKSSGQLDASRLQLEYYIWYLYNTRNRQYDGEIRIPEERKTKEIQFDSIRITKIQSAVKSLYSLYVNDELPEFEEIPACEHCAYKEICWGGQP